MSKRLPKDVWIIDTGASDHMSNSMDCLTEYRPCKTLIEISIADGTISLALGFGKVCISSLKLNAILYVPRLSYNLLSVNRTTNDMNCKVIFFPSFCLFQDQTLGMMIGSAEAKDGLYWLKGSPSNPFHSNKVVLNVNSNVKAML